MTLGGPKDVPVKVLSLLTIIERLTDSQDPRSFGHLNHPLVHIC